MKINEMVQETVESGISPLTLSAIGGGFFALAKKLRILA